MSSLTITVNGTTQVVQLGTLSAAVNEQITQAVSSASASAAAAAASAASVSQPATTNTLGAIKVGANLTIEEDGTLNATGGGGSTNWYLGSFAANARPTPTTLGQFGFDLSNGLIFAVQLTPSVVWWNIANQPV